MAQIIQLRMTQGRFTIMMLRLSLLSVEVGVFSAPITIRFRRE